MRPARRSSDRKYGLASCQIVDSDWAKPKETSDGFDAA
jgi:hypothetical protein